MQTLVHPTNAPHLRPVTRAIVWLGILAALASMSAHSFLLFHSSAELFAICIGIAIFFIAWNSRTITSTEYLLFIGIGYVAVSTIDFFHLLAFPGLNVLTQTRGLSSQLWLSARFVEAVTMLAAPLFLKRRVSPPLLLAIFAAVTAGLLAWIFSGAFPATVRDARTTVFKSASEIVLAAMFALAIIAIWRHRQELDSVIFRLVAASLALRVACELSLAVYTDPFGTANLVGHLLKIAATYLLYKALVENMLMRPYAALFKNLKKREEDLESAISDLEAFSYSVSHDLRAHLTSIIGFSDLLESTIHEADDEKRIEYARHIHRAGNRMDQIIDDLLRLGKLSRQELQISQVDLSELANDVVYGLRASDRNRRVEVVIEPGMCATGDGGLMHAALENLIGNSWKFTSHVPDARIEIGLASGALYVRDNGAGFDGQKADSLFSPYTRLHSADEFAGSGIGLATVQRIVKRHGGSVWAEGRVGQGATFYVGLPDIRRKPNT